MVTKNLAEELSSNSYPGRGIVLGRSADGKHAVIAYFIMGRSENSRNRVFVEDGAGIKTKAFDESKMVDPSLIIYSPVRVLEKTTVVTNGDQTDTIYDFLQQGKSFEDALRTRTFEPDGPNFTPRISGVVELETNCYKLSILKSAVGRNPRPAAISLTTMRRALARAISSIPMRGMETRCHLLRASRPRSSWKGTSTPLPRWYGML